MLPPRLRPLAPNLGRYDMTTIDHAARAKVIADAAAAALAAPAGQRPVNTVPYRGQRLALPVAHVPLDHVLLNPRSHRIRAQLQSESAEQATTVATDPYGEASQEILRALLSSTEGFAKIKIGLEREGQIEAGVITAGGVLINANTRAVALAELGKPVIDVMVLPDDATDRDLNELELTLQMARDTKQDYSFTSQLLFIEDLINSQWSIEELGMSLRPDLPDTPAGRKDARAHVQSELRLLSLIRDVITLSGGAAKFIDFDERRQALIEIDSDYEALKNKNPTDASRLRDAQLAGMLSNIDYRKLRNVDLRLLNRYLPEALEGDPVLGSASETLLSGDVADVVSEIPDTQLDGLDLLDEDEDDSSSRLPSFRTVLTLIAQTDPDGVVLLTVDGEERQIERTQFIAAVEQVFLNALSVAAADSSRTDAVAAPTKFLLDAVRAVDNARDAFTEVANRGDFDRDKFDIAREKLDETLEQLTATVDEQLRGVADVPTLDATAGTDG
jgi:hypothetical protein